MKNFKNVSKVFSILFAAVLVLAACGSGTTGKSGELRLATALKSNSINSLTTSEAVNFQIIGNIQEGLMTYAEDGKLVGSMAESWKVSDDATEYTFKLRDSKWSNGEPVTANDFVFAWQTLATTTDASYKSMLADLKNGSEVLAGDMKPEELGVEAINDKELKVTLVAPRLYILDLLAFATFSPINEEFFNSVGADAYGTTADTVLANGPYKLTEYSGDSGYTLVKNDGYWDAANVKVNTVTTRVVEQLDTQATLYENGEIDRLALTGELVERFADSKEKVLQEEATIFYFYMSGTTAKEDKVLANKNFRAAVAHSIDKTILSDQLLKNGSLPADYLIPKGFVKQDGKDFREVSGQFNDPMFSTAKAKEYLDAAKAELGEEPLTFKIVSAETATNKLLYTNIKSQIETNLPGVTVELELMTQQLLYPELQKLATPSGTAGWGADFVDLATFFSIFRTGDSHNYGVWSNARFDELYAQSETETDPAARWQMFVEMEEILLNDYAIVPTFQRGSMALVKPNVKGLKLNTTAPDMFFKYVTVE